MSAKKQTEMGKKTVERPLTSSTSRLQSSNTNYKIHMLRNSSGMFPSGRDLSGALKELQGGRKKSKSRMYLNG